MTDQQNKNTKRKHWLKIGAWFVGIALFLFIGLFFLTNWLQNKLEKMVAQQSNGVYELSLYGLQVSPFIGSMSLDSLSLVPDYERWRQLQTQKKEVANMLLDAQTGPIDLNGINVLGILFGKEASLDDLTILNPHMLMTVMDQDTTTNQKPLYKSVPKRLKGLQVGVMDLDSGQFRYRKGTDEGATVFSLGQFNLTVDDFKLDSQSYKSEERIFYARRILFGGSGAKYFTPDGLYRLTADTVQANTDKRMLHVKQVNLKPTVGPTELAQAKGEATAHMKLEVPLIVLNGLDYPALSQHKNLLVRYMRIEDPTLTVFKDKKNFENKTKRPLPHEIVQRMNMKFLLDSVELKNGFVQYEEIVPKAVERGQITLENLEATFTNVSNMPEHISMENPAVAQASGMIMGKAPVSLTSRMPLLNENGYHTLHIELGETNPEILNPIIAPTGFVRVESGHISRGSVDVELTNDKATGTLRLIYSNFEIELLSKGTGGEQSLGKEILSELANWVAVKESNPDDKGEEPRVGEIKVEYKKKESLFKYWVDCILNGFMSIATIK